MPRPPATVFHRQAQHTVVSTAMPAAAASARPSTARTPSRNGPVPSRQTRTRERQGGADEAAPGPHGPAHAGAPSARGGRAARRPATSCGAAGTAPRRPRRRPARTRSSTAARGRARRGKPERPGRPGRPRSARRRRRRSGRGSGRGCRRTSRGRASAARRAGARAAPDGRWPDRRAGTRSPGPSARSTQNRWSSVHTDPCHQIIASTGAAAASASRGHGHDRRAGLAPTMPAVEDADREQRGEVGRRLDHEGVQRAGCAGRRSPPPRRRA